MRNFFHIKYGTDKIKKKILENSSSYEEDEFLNFLKERASKDFFLYEDLSNNNHYILISHNISHLMSINHQENLSPKNKDKEGFFWSIFLEGFFSIIIGFGIAFLFQNIFEKKPLERTNDNIKPILINFYEEDFFENIKYKFSFFKKITQKYLIDDTEDPIFILKKQETKDYSLK